LPGRGHGQLDSAVHDPAELPLRKVRGGHHPVSEFRRDLSEDLADGLDHYAVALKDPEGNEFDIN